MVEIKRRCPSGDDIGFDRGGAGVLALGQVKVGGHPVGKQILVLGD